jgi:hypothetical protein
MIGLLRATGLGVWTGMGDRSKKRRGSAAVHDAPRQPSGAWNRCGLPTAAKAMGAKARLTGLIEWEPVRGG